MLVVRPLNERHVYMLNKTKKQKIIKKYQQHEGDTGSSEVQIAILSSEIDELVGHLKTHHKDHSSRRGLLKKVGERRRLLRYLQKENAKSYEELVVNLKLKQAKQLIRKKLSVGRKGRVIKPAVEEKKDENKSE